MIDAFDGVLKALEPNIERAGEPSRYCADPQCGESIG